MNTQHNLINLFNQYFEVIPADTPEKLRECYRLRYAVLCEELQIPGFESECYPDRLETDQYDKRSIHCLMIHKPTRKIAGTVRIILAEQENLNTKFPIESAADTCFFHNIIPYESISRSRLAEISRLILAPEFRARKGENQQPYGVRIDSESFTDQNERRQSKVSWQNLDNRRNNTRRSFPHAALGLIIAILRMSVEHNVIYAYCGMEPACARFLQSFGINFTPISPMVNYHGLRRCYIGYGPDIMENIFKKHPPVWELIEPYGKTFLTKNNDQSIQF